MKVLVSGATGFVGTHVVKLLLEQGHTVFALTRSKKDSDNKNLHYLFWENVHTPFEAPEGIEGVINLVGENIANTRWSNEKKKSIYNSRIDGTRTIIKCLQNQNLKAFVSASALGIYGSKRSEILTEEASLGDDFLAKVCIDWEKAAQSAQSFSKRVVIYRIGTVLGKGGGMIKSLHPLFDKGLGGKLASGQQYMSWIHVSDLAKLFVEAVLDDSFTGVFNAVTPYPVKNKNFTELFGKVLEKKTFFPVPSYILKVIKGEFSEIILSDQKVSPTRLRAKKFHFRYPTLELALKEVVSQKR